MTNGGPVVPGPEILGNKEIGDGIDKNGRIRTGTKQAGILLTGEKTTGVGQI